MRGEQHEMEEEEEKEESSKKKRKKGRSEEEEEEEISSSLLSDKSKKRRLSSKEEGEVGGGDVNQSNINKNPSSSSIGPRVKWEGGSLVLEESSLVFSSVVVLLYLEYLNYDENKWGEG